MSAPSRRPGWLVTDAELTSAAGDAGSDPVVGQQMIARDRFHRPETQTAHPDTGGDVAPADEPRADRSGGDLTAAGTDSAEASAAAGEKDAGLRVYGDSAYGTGAARAAYRDAGHQTVIKPKPLRPAVPGGFTLDDFTVDEPAGAVTCPAGHTRPMSPKRTVTFGRLCADCSLRRRCTSAADGRSMSIHPHEQLLRAARDRHRHVPQHGAPVVRHLRP